MRRCLSPDTFIPFPANCTCAALTNSMGEFPKEKRQRVGLLDIGKWIVDTRESSYWNEKRGV